jgi:hypothetical protein
MSAPYFDKDMAKILYNLGESMIYDDRGDLGWVTYRNRRLHQYGGKPAPNHSSPVHHWMAGTALCLMAQAMALVATAQEAKAVYDDIELELSQPDESSVSAEELSRLENHP